MTFAIRVDNLGKRYRLGATHAGSIRELVNQTWKRLMRRRDTLLPHEHAELQALTGAKVEEDGSFWALRDVSFEVQPGEVVGIIGRNGSGKSTLLKILSQITSPTTGRVELHGRVASLLEVGTGFHPELSGRENVFLNGAVLGMTKPEIRRKFDEIVAFAEIEQFIDTPVKRYSSGMYVRLAFAIAAHLDPEILIVDEVLAVGDIAFQEKCIGKMGSVARQGRTIVLVSHNMLAVKTLCASGCLLQDGKLVCRGSVDQCGEHYRSQFAPRNFVTFATAVRPDDSAPLWIESVRLVSGVSNLPCLPLGAPLGFQIAFRATGVLAPKIGVKIRNRDGQPIVSANNRFLPSGSSWYPSKAGVIDCEFGKVPLMPGRYHVSFYLGTERPHHDWHILEDVLSFELVEEDIWGQGHAPPKNGCCFWWPATFTMKAERDCHAPENKCNV